MAWFSGSIARTDVTQYVKAFTRDGSVCDTSYGAVFDMDTRAPTVQPASLIEFDVDHVRWFTGYVVSSTIQRSAGRWVNRVVCDHKALKRLRDYYWTDKSFDIYDNYVDHVIDLCFDLAGATSIFDYDISDVLIPPYTWNTGVSAYDVVIDCCLFGMLQPNPYPDGTVHFQKMRPTATESAINVTDRSTFHERRVDDAYFRTAALVLGWATEASFISGSSPYGYDRIAVVANPHLISADKVYVVAEQMVQEFNQLATIEKNTVPTRERINLGDSILYEEDRYDKVGVVMRNSVSITTEGFVQTITTGENCPKIFGFEPPQPPPIVAKDTVVVMTDKKLGRSFNFFTSDTPNWTPIDNSMGASITSFNNIVLNQTTGEAWLSIKSTVGDSYEGVWYCPDISDDTVSWTRAISAVQMRSDAGVSTSDVRFIAGPLCFANNQCYAMLEGTTGMGTTVHFWYGTSTLAHDSFSEAPTSYDAPGHTQFASSCTSGTKALFGMSGNYNAAGHAVNLITKKVERQCTLGLNNCRVVWSAGDTDSVVCGNIDANTNFDVTVYANSRTDRPIVEKDSHQFWTRSTDDYLMQDGIVQAIPNDVGADAGVFSTSGATGAAYDFVYSYGQIMWVASTAAVNNSKRSIAYTENGGTLWLTKDGDWATAMGGAWPGAGTSVPIIRFAAVMPA